MWSDLVHQHLTLLWFRYVNHLLHHVVGILILHHDVQCTVSNEALHQNGAMKRLYQNENHEQNKTAYCKSMEEFNTHAERRTKCVIICK